MALKLYSDIYPPDIKPVRKGWYPSSWTCSGNLVDWPRRRWDGAHWRNPDGSRSWAQGLHWYGLAIDVNAAEPIRRGDNYLAGWPGVFVFGAEVE